MKSFVIGGGSLFVLALTTLFGVSADGATYGALLTAIILASEL